MHTLNNIDTLLVFRRLGSSGFKDGVRHSECVFVPGNVNDLPEIVIVFNWSGS
jgi:hypothetical protein